MVGLGNPSQCAARNDLGRLGTLAYGWRSAPAYRWRMRWRTAGVPAKFARRDTINLSHPTLA